MDNKEQKAYFQKEREDTFSKTVTHGWGDSETIAVDGAVHSLEEWGMRLTEAPYLPYGEMKDLYSNDWKDESGDDEYVPDEPILKSGEIELGIVYTGAGGTATDKIRSFINYLAYGGQFMMWLGYGDYGRRACRYENYDENAQCFTQVVHENGAEKVVETVSFKVTIKVNDPETLVRPTYLNGEVKNLTT